MDRPVVLENGAVKSVINRRLVTVLLVSSSNRSIYCLVKIMALVIIIKIIIILIIIITSV